MKKDRVTEYLTLGREGHCYLFSEIETEFYSEVLICKSEELGLTGEEEKSTWQEVARLDPELRTVRGACTYFTGGPPRGVPYEALGAINRYLLWKGDTIRSDGPTYGSADEWGFVRATKNDFLESLRQLDALGPYKGECR